MPPASLSKREACDNCYKRKIRCDGDTSPGNVCSECSAMNLQCTRNIVKRKRGPKPRYPLTPSDSEPVHSLISAILADPTAFSVPTSVHAVRKMLVDLASHSQALEKELASLRSISSLPGETSATSSSLNTSVEDASPTNETDPADALGDQLQGLSLNHYQGRHFGESSWHLMFHRTAAIGVGDKLDGRTERIPADLKRSEFWDLKPWQLPPQYESIPHEYPPNDLLESLLALYWEHVHPIYPLLHKPIFERSLAAKLHLYDRTFGSTVLAVCALASRHSDDPRVLYDGTTSKHSAGWKYFNQIKFAPKSFVETPSVYKLQVYALCITFMIGTNMAETMGVLIGPGIQLAQIIGVHHSGFGKGRDRKEVELCKRAFWLLVTLDVTLSLGIGRPRSSNANDFDLEPPAMCDDEYWDTPDPEDAFKQPENKPATLAFWAHHIKLMEIAGFAQRSIYSARRLDPWGPSTLSAAEWNQKAVMELDSALNEWIDALPDFLKYNPDQKDIVFVHQSVILYAGFYWTRIQVHKRFIPRLGQKSILALHSLAICANAARSCIHLLDGHHEQYKLRIPPLVPAIFGFAIILLINLWHGIQSRMSLNLTKEMDDIWKCLDLLALYEDRWEMAGRFRDILLSVISVSQLPAVERLPSLKRNRDRYEEDSFPANSITDEFQLNAGHQQMSQLQYDASTETLFDSFNVNLEHNFEWSSPISSNDLGDRMPVHIGIGTDMDVPFDSMTYRSENTLPNQGLDGMGHEFSPGQTTDRNPWSQNEWNQFMAEVDELLQLINHPAPG
ncbi:hypothetical protein GYMLUDRAFT_47729 [Collybiopsis luxurians FD-317 M1]|uniref:Zn(2)-C6 fungal-type domain-containing protein n=1 Tax=Collybiopsis luxurians FD-317 M1 TaxID=944289 RepID=A0A0D0CKD6_9AGAR|nr:hypothetical protein GYMLUDRAFT_47729 [Collybiopsis luxurians FD-317 M1]